LTNVTRAIATGVKDPQPPSAWCRTSGRRSGFVRIVDENGTVVVGDWANADGGFGLHPVDHGEQERNGVPGPGASSP